jgi:hypothetical protein
MRKVFVNGYPRARKRTSARLANDRCSAAGPNTIEIPRGRFACFAGHSPEILTQSKAVGQLRSGFEARIPSVEAT